MKKRIEINKRDLVVLIVIACIIVFIDFKYIVRAEIGEMSFANQMQKIATKNEDTVFSVDKIVFYSSANAIDNSEGETLQDLNICQFTDIAIYLDNQNSSTDLTGENTIKELYVNNMKIESTSQKGEKTLSYKNPLYYGKFRLPSEDSEDTINFNVVYTNEDNDKSDYIDPTFYTDCSNPITLGYMNKNIVKNYSVTEQGTEIKFDGSILQATNVELDDLKSNVSFDIHIKNNLDEEFVCNIGFEVPIQSDTKNIYEGYMYSMQKDLQDTYKFFKI